MLSFGRGVPTPCTNRQSPLRSIAQSTREEFHPPTFHIRNFVRRHFTSGYLTTRWERRTLQLLRIYISGPSDFTSGYLTAGWERRTFQLLRSDISRSSDSVHPESICGRHFRLPGFCTMLQCSPEASRYLPPTKIFSLKIFCVNFYFLLVISQRYYWDIS